MNDKRNQLSPVIPCPKLSGPLRPFLLTILLLTAAGCSPWHEFKDNGRRESSRSASLVASAKDQFNARQYQEARKTLHQAIGIDGSNVEAYKWLAITIREIITTGYDEKIYEDTDYFRTLVFEGYGALDMAVRLAPNDGEILLLRGIAGVAMPFFVRKLDTGIDDLNRVLETDVHQSKKDEALYWLGKAYQKKAMSYWMKVLDRNPKSKVSQDIFDSMRPGVGVFDLSQYELPILAIDFVIGFQDELFPQIAVWIEDRDGRFVKTVFVSGFSGYAREKQVRLPEWAKASKYADVDAVTGASINLGHHIYTWALKDISGTPVKAGKYAVNVEIAYWPSMQYQLVSATVTLGEKRDHKVVEEGNLIPYLKVSYYPR